MSAVRSWARSVVGWGACVLVACAGRPGAGAAAPVIHGDCDASDDAGALEEGAAREELFAARLSYRQTDDRGQPIGVACDLAAHRVTSEGMANVPLHCSGRSQAEEGYARVGARWGTRRGAPSCTTEYCAVVYVRGAGGALREAVRDVHLRDRFFCSQGEDRNEGRIDVDACTYADVVGALKGTGSTDDDASLTFDARGKLEGFAARGLTLAYRMYPCARGVPAR